MTYREPLWRAMEDASTAIIPPSSKCYAAELRAIADWLVPEELIPRTLQGHRIVAIQERRRIRRVLLAEANRAEAGE
jgi:hypothetical protein